MTTSSHADRVHHLTPLPAAARTLGISPRLLKDAIHRGQVGQVRLLQVGARQFVQSGLLFDYIESTKAPRTAQASDLFAS